MQTLEKMMPKCKFDDERIQKPALNSIKKQLLKHFLLMYIFLYTIKAIGFLRFCLHRKNEYLVHFSGESN